MQSPQEGEIAKPRSQGGISLPFLSRHGYFQLSWADTIEDRADLVESYSSTFWNLLLNRHGLQKYVSASQEKLLSGRWAKLEVARSGLATSLILIKDYGKDLYVSYRMFMKRPFAKWKIIVFALLHFLVFTIPFLWGLFILTAAVGFFRSNDMFVLFRAPVREFHWDDMYALMITVDKVMRETAQQLDVKTALRSAPSPDSIRPVQHL
jgi:hypothetical protein